jgi:hypothetical protein
VPCKRQAGQAFRYNLFTYNFRQAQLPAKRISTSILHAVLILITKPPVVPQQKNQANANTRDLIFLKKNFVREKKRISLHSRLIKSVVLLNEITSESSSVGRA